MIACRHGPRLSIGCGFSADFCEKGRPEFNFDVWDAPFLQEASPTPIARDSSSRFNWPQSQSETAPKMRNSRKKKIAAPSGRGDHGYQKVAKP
jgi:hypothetical protein